LRARLVQVDVPFDVVVVILPQVDGVCRFEIYAEIDVALDVIALVLAMMDALVHGLVHGLVDVALHVVALLVLASIYCFVRLEVRVVHVSLGVLLFLWLEMHVLLLHGGPPFELPELAH
jgi:hypothetical protein